MTEMDMKGISLAGETGGEEKRGSYRGGDKEQREMTYEGRDIGEQTEE
jgi:hypothetical protein